MNKVLAIVSYPYLPYHSGGQKSIAQFLDYLGRETELTVIGTANNDFSLAKTYKTLPLLKNSSARYRDTSLVEKIVSYIKRENIDTIIWEHPYYAWLQSRVKKKTGIKTVLHIHNIEHQRFKSLGKWWWRILRVYEKWAFKTADRILCVVPEDAAFAIREWGIDKAKCIDAPFGVDIGAYPTDKAESSRKVSSLHRINPNEKILLFNGALGYKPNLDAVKVILDNINPLLLNNTGFAYKIVICGKGLPAEMNELKAYADRNIVFAGFVDDIELYFKAADLFLNPVQTGGGIKTKMVESIAYGTTVISTESGAAGMNMAVCGDKLVIVPDNDWTAFAKAVMDNVNANTVTPQRYYDHYYYGSSIKRTIAALS